MLCLLQVASTHDSWLTLITPLASLRFKLHQAAEHDKTLCTMAFSPTRLLRDWIAKLGGERFRPLYSAVAFSAEPYGDCIKVLAYWHIGILAYWHIGIYISILASSERFLPSPFSALTPPTPSSLCGLTPPLLWC
jgi:hypothetical protein